MSFDSNTIIISQELKQRQIWSSLVILVPYMSHHVPKYNEWMQNVDLQHLTGSNPLTLDDEFKMLESWNKDPQKCTFIVLDRLVYDSLSNIGNVLEREVQSMIGDVNIYVSGEDSVAELSIMIAETNYRGKGRGKETVALMMKFGYEILGIQKFRAIIQDTNITSQKLFTNAFGFAEVSRSSVFNEITYHCDLSVESNPSRQIFEKIQSKYILLNSENN